MDNAQVEAVARAMTKRQREALRAIAAIGPSEYERGFQAAKEGAGEAILDVRSANAGNMERRGQEWRAYDTATLDCHTAISNMEPGK